MRPLKLDMQAFGPYAGMESIDFTQLGNRTMFVISGKTGAGKTSIFDGISFAIYGKASGEDRNGADLRSHFAKDDLPTEISLEFSLKDKVYYIWRSPQQEKRKARGEGYTIVNAKAELYVRDETGSRKLLAANVRETDEKIKEIIQLDSNQFRQILMIPQGDFRKLLTSDSKEKEMILQRLFHTEQYKKIEESLKERAGSLKNEAETGIELRSQKLKSLYTNGNEELESALVEKSPSDTIVLPLLDQVMNDMQSLLVTLTNDIEQKQKDRDEAKIKMNEAESLMQAINQLDVLKQQKASLDAKSSEVEEQKKAIDRAKRAANLVHQENLCKRLKKDLDDAVKRKAIVEKQLAATSKEKMVAEEQLKAEEANKNKREQSYAETAHLESLREDVLAFDQRKAELQSLEQKTSKYRQQIQADKLQLTQLEEIIDKQQKHLQELRQLQDNSFQLEKEKYRLENDLDQLELLSKSIEQDQAASARFGQHENHLSSAKKRSNDAFSTLQHLENLWYSGQAAILAGRLSSGSPCPVCGSHEHPSPTSLDEDLISEEDLKAAKRNAEHLEQELLGIQQAWMEAKAEMDLWTKTVSEREQAVKKLIPNFQLENLSQHFEEMKNKKNDILNQLERNQVHTDKIPEIDHQLMLNTQKQKELNVHLEEAADQERLAVDELMEVKMLVQSLTLNLPDGVETKEQYDKRLGSLQKKIKQFDEALKQAQDHYAKLNEQLASQKGTIENLNAEIEKAEKTLTIEREAFINKLHDEGFISYNQYDASKREYEWIKRAEEQVQSYGEEYRSITDRLKDYEERLKGTEKPNLSQLEEHFRKQEHLLALMNEQYSNAFMQLRKNEEIQRNVKRLNEQIKTIEKQYEVIGHLSDITRGQNTYRLTFERFVLASFLDDILAAANGRLRKMTSGRYQLLRKRDRSKGNIQSGLELLVFDQYTGVERHVKTLSGGESFKAALSLALGLSDVVQEHAGGVSLETMFIDEGFGTLDPESLDQAIEALVEIQSSGRLVGLISHVPELKERIDARLEVLAGQSGSSTKFVFLS